MKIAVIGAGWAGMAAAVHATEAGHAVTVFEASSTLGGRARAVQANLPDGQVCYLDNGQHILIGAYRSTFSLMQKVGVDVGTALLRTPLRLQSPEGTGLRLPSWPGVPQALRLAAGILQNREWRWQDKWSLVRAASAWRLRGFACGAEETVGTLCRHVSAQVMETLIEPLCVSALNTPSTRASGQVFLRVLQDALWGGPGSSDLLLPRTDLSSLFPQAAAHWFTQRGGELHTATRIACVAALEDGRWQINDAMFDRVILATSASAAHALMQQSVSHAMPSTASAMLQWGQVAQDLQYEQIATVYAYAPHARLPHPMLALHSDPAHPAQFVFDKGQLGGPHGMFAFVASANTLERSRLQAKVLQQGQAQLAPFLGTASLSAIQTIVEKRATFACTPGLRRPQAQVAPGLVACGDYVAGPYPATLEGAVRSGLQAVQLAVEADAAISLSSATYRTHLPHTLGTHL